MPKKINTLVWMICVIFIFTAVTGCGGNPNQLKNNQAGNTEQNQAEETEQNLADYIVSPPLDLDLEFAAYKEEPVNFTPVLEPYAVEPGLANITNREMFSFSPEAEQLLIKNGFVVVPNQHHREFFMLYEINSYEPAPSFITTDSMLHNYHLFFSHLLRVIEKEKLSPELIRLTTAMLSESEKQYKALEGSDWENAARRNMGFFAVAARLLDLEISVPEPVKQTAAEELALINSHTGIEVSPLMNMGQGLQETDALQEDYSQYIPRGHYDTEELLKSYFKTMMWYGRMTFRLKSEDETKSAVLVTLALGAADNAQKWDKIYQPSCFFVGKSDDLSYLQYRELL